MKENMASDVLLYVDAEVALASGAIRLLKHDICVLLVNRRYEFDFRHSTLEDVSPYEIRAAGYRRGGQALTAKTLCGGTFRAANVVWDNPELGQLARGAILYSSEPFQLLCFWSLPRIEARGDETGYLIRWHPSGLFSPPVRAARNLARW